MVEMIKGNNLNKELCIDICNISSNKNFSYQQDWSLNHKVEFLHRSIIRFTSYKNVVYKILYPLLTKMIAIKTFWYMLYCLFSSTRYATLLSTQLST